MSIFANAAVHPAKDEAANPHDAVNGNPSESMTFASDSPFLRKSNGVFSTLWQWKYYWSHAGREMKKRKCNFFLGVLCCFLVVLIAAFCYTLISKAPVVFLSQGEASNGQIDVQFKPADTSNAPFLNYTQMVLNTAFSAEFSKHSPRLVIGGVSMYDKTCTNYINGNISNPSELSWRYDGSPRYPQCAGSVSCLPTMCPSVYKFIEIDFYDTASEKAMGLGRLWPFSAPPVGTAIVHSSAANRRGIRPGDTFWVTVPVATWPLLENVLVQGMLGLGISSNDAQTILQLAKQHPAVVMPVVAQAVTSDMKGKFPTTLDSMIAMEYSSFIPALIYNLHPAILNYTFTGYSYSAPVNTSVILSRANPKEFATEINSNLGGNRVDAYMSTNYDLIQKRLINFSSRLIYFVGFPDVDVNLGILRTMNGARFFVLYLGLILSVILTILFILATMLIYSLLLISIETRTFELGVHRMVGMKRLQIVQMLLTQALSYAIPAWIVGLIVAQAATFFAVNILEKRIEVPVEKRLIPDAIGIATFLGIFMPLVAATLPIRNALSRNLHDSLDTQHSKTLAVKITITRTDDQGMSSAWIVVGLGLFIFGFCIYYLVPLALLSFNLALFFNIFFALLIGMLLGLIVLSLNFEHLLEQFLTLIFFWWENRAIRSVTLKNLVAHRMRNRKTTIMYALALGFIIFITVAFSMELKTAVANGLKGSGAEMTVTASDDNWLFYPYQVAELEQIMAANRGVADWTWVTADLGATTVSGSRSAGVTLTNLGHISETGVGVFGISPNFYDVSLNEFLIPSDSDGSNGLSLAEQLYTATGSQTALLGTNFKDSTAIETRDTSFILAHPYNSDQYSSSSLDLRIIRPAAFLDASPLFSFSKFPANTGNRQTVISIPAFMRMTNGSLTDVASVPMKTLLIKFTGSASDTDKDNLLLDLQDFADTWNSVDIFDYRDSKDTMDKTNAVMSLIFGAAAYVAMGLCMFSLMASMFTNIYEQTKEIAILRAMGLRRFQIIRIYIYEAFVLVAAASCLGVLIGTIMAWTMMLQRVLFTQVPLTMDFPYILFLEVLAGAAVVAVLSSFTPAYTLVKKSVSQVMRTVV